MTFNLFFSTRSAKRAKYCNNSFVVSVLLLLLCLPQFFSALSAVDDPPQTGQIFVSGNAVIFGVENLSNAVIVKKQKPEAKKIKTAPAQVVKMVDQIATVDNKRLKEAKKIQAVINSRIKIFISENNSSNSISSIIGSDKNCAAALVITGKNKYFDNSAKSFSANIKVLATLKKQKFYTSVSCLPFREFSNSSLRAPPADS